MDMIELAERCERGSGPDRRLDYEVFTKFAVRDAANFWDPKTGHEYTSSLDASVALLERVLPGSYAELDFGIGRPQAGASVTFSVEYRSHGEVEYDRKTVHADATSPARALLAAILRALGAKDGTP